MAPGIKGYGKKRLDWRFSNINFRIFELEKSIGKEEDITSTEFTREKFYNTIAVLQQIFSSFHVNLKEEKYSTCQFNLKVRL